MNLHDELLKEHSKKHAYRMALWIGDNQEKFKVLMNLFLGDEYKICQRAAWVVSICTESNPELIRPYIKKLISNMKKPVHDAVKRNTLRIFEQVELPDSCLGSLADICFQFLTSGNEPIAVKAYSIGIIQKIGKKEPELLQELKIILEDQLPFAGPAIRSRAKKVLKFS